MNLSLVAKNFDEANKSIAKSFSTNYSPKKEKFVVTMYRTLYYIISIILLVGSFYSMWIAAYK